MDRRLALTALGAIPLLALAFWGLTRILPPLTGYAAGLGLYWLGLAALLFRRTDLRHLMRPVWPGWPLALLCGLPVLALAGAAVATPGVGSLGAGVIAAVAIGALCNGTLEELFWRGAILPRPTLPAAFVALALFTAWHLALLAATGVTVTGGAPMLLGGAAALGAIWMATRLRSGTAGAGILSHVGLNLFAFLQLAAVNLG